MTIIGEALPPGGTLQPLIPGCATILLDRCLLLWYNMKLDFSISPYSITGMAQRREGYAGVAPRDCLVGWWAKRVMDVSRILKGTKMKLQAKILVLVVALVVSALVGQSSAQPLDRYIVTIQGPAEEAVGAVMHAGGNVIHVYDIIPAIAIQIPEQALAGLRRNPLVVAIEPDLVVTALGKPSKPQPPQPPQPPTPTQLLPWGVDRIDAELAWSYSTGLGVKVAVVDTGIDYTHPDLKDNCKGGVNILSSRRSPMDDNGHGTHVAGIIAASNNSIGVVGVAPEASLYAVKVLGRSGSGWVTDIIKGLEWCVVNKMDVVNMSLGSPSDAPDFEKACNNARAAGVILVAAAGNEGSDVSYPAAYDSVIAVSATDKSNNVASWSNFGPEVDIAAPGVSIYSTYMGGGYATMSGTSMAAPHVAGTLALILSRFDLSAAGAESKLLTTADNLGSAGWDELFGNGLVDAELVP